MFLYAAKKIFGTRNDRILKSMKPLVSRVNELEAKFKLMNDDELRNQTAIFRQRLANGESLESIQPEAFAAVREASVRTLGMRHFDVQLIGGAVLHRGMIAEMKTGEGKTLVATLAAYLNALSGKGVHVVTVNDYLAKRDSEWMGRVYNFLGLSVGVVYAGMEDEDKRNAYNSDITYGQNNEFGFDYLRDNMKFTAERMYQRGHNYAIVDEVDSILIDEARTPLIISGPAEESTDLYQRVDRIIPQLIKGQHFDVELKTKQPTLTESGVVRCEELLGVNNLYDPSNLQVLHHVQNALKAHSAMVRDSDYVVRDGKVIIVDEFTGRLMDGRRWSDGLHQAVEAKEGVPIARENQTLASITFQNYFRMYKKLSGMTGTADTEAVEFNDIYKLEVVVIPTNKPMVRADESDQVFRTRKEKYEAVCKDIAEINKTGQPILVGTISIEQSESLSKTLQRFNIKHNVLNAKHHEREAEIVAQAGRYGSVTISTNMAGRGTDIVLGGNAEFLAFAEAGTRNRDDEAFKTALEKYKEACKEEKSRVLAAGGLFILGTERHEARRIDNQLRGRSGRQGDPGRTRFYVSLEDDLMQRFGGDRIKNIMEKLGWDEGMAIDGYAISRSIETAQKRVEAYHFEARKHVTEYDDVMNKQRQVVYNLRSRVLHGENVREQILEMVDDLLEANVVAVCDEQIKPNKWELNKLEELYQFLFNTPFKFASDVRLDAQNIFDEMRKSARALYSERVETVKQKLDALDAILRRPDAEQVEAEDPNKRFFDFEQHIVLETLDHLWNVHLQEMDFLRDGIGLRGYGQKNPLHEYQKEGFILFQRLMAAMKETILRKLFYYQVPEPEELIAQLEAERRRREEMERRMHLVHQATLADAENVDEGEGAADSSKSPDEQRAKLEAQKRARRKAKR